MNIYKQIDKNFVEDNNIFPTNIFIGGSIYIGHDIEKLDLNDINRYIRVAKAEKASNSQSYVAIAISALALLVSVAVALMNSYAANEKFVDFMVIYLIFILVVVVALILIEKSRLRRYRLATYLVTYLEQIKETKT